ncbi:hypothetical protein LEP1GSC107_0603 [Leptospira interrogans serovar Grippotyphosa str. UI 12769]|uniref:Uncharacterized protein n=3 Tax=Leptospira interrogans TaxID=173 RepID=A0A0E2DAZ1_LEPIR|nr:hypothetical protein [Leptospira interrogans]EMF40511.1 hypothetical protein LEP1GSC067_2357 [Leptospira interrogans serovar Lora str. TE 1992]MCR8649761.1 hypothetical protein [Leptospira interrogans serovar Bataviae]EKR57253.1 hypothetical protein LEP1GSC105_3600 [Leptospira interrogans str. UI 12758]EMJ35976.1 hypothetical protein LEP1GSC079_0320 [Leptospira interrogans str. FPW1039]EMJ55679.1 hypothetical protein LEP1GSC111_3213 [Leptospira interrogans str. UT126]
MQRKRIKNTTFRYHWERRFKNQDKDGFVEVPVSDINISSSSELLILKINSSGKACLQINLQLSLGQWS